jgi:hypothetical protein
LSDRSVSANASVNPHRALACIFLGRCVSSAPHYSPRFRSRCCSLKEASELVSCSQFGVKASTAAQPSSSAKIGACACCTCVAPAQMTKAQLSAYLSSSVSSSVYRADF